MILAFVNLNNTNKIMNLTELRIGNYVCTSYMKKGVFKVNAIHSDRLYFESVIENFKSDTIPIYVEPISLTEKWLLKAGFERVFHTGSTYSLRDFNVSDFGENGIYHYYVKQPMKYVHQLQNLYFAMTGEKLVINFNYG